MMEFKLLFPLWIFSPIVARTLCLDVYQSQARPGNYSTFNLALSELYCNTYENDFLTSKKSHERSGAENGVTVLALRRA